MRRQKLTIFLALFFVAIVLGVLHITKVLKPVESALAQVPRPIIYVLRGTGNSFKNFFGYFSTVKKINNENITLKEKVRSLQEANIVLKQYEAENEKLKKELGYRKTAAMNLISATAIAGDPTGFSQSLLLNVGSRDGIEVGAAVLAQGVFVGKISSVNDFTSRVTLVTDPDSAIDAQIAGTDERAILRGSHGSGIILDLISQSAQLSEGQEVVTAGLSSEIPKGILIGTIGVITSNRNDLSQAVTVISSVDLKNLDYLSVIKK